MAKSNKIAEQYEDKKYHNTWILLSKYRNVLWNVEQSISDLNAEFHEEYKSSIDEFLNSMHMAGADLNGTRLERHARTIDRSNKMIKIINHAVNILRTKPKDGEKYYWVLYHTYLSPKEYESINEILETIKKIPAFKRLKKFSKATYYRIKRDAVGELSSILWGYSSRDCNEILEAFFPEESQSGNK